MKKRSEKIKKTELFSCDFETTVDEDTRTQEDTEVWAAAFARLYSEETGLFNHIDDFMKWLFRMERNRIVYFHNLKFDGHFIIDYLLTHGFTYYHRTKPREKMPSKHFDCLISANNQWYTIIVSYRNHTIEIRDSFKLLPFSLEAIGEAFKTKHRKSSITYKGTRKAGDPINPDDGEYVLNDVLVLKEALEFMIDAGHSNLTIASNAMSYFKEHAAYTFKDLFHDLSTYGCNITREENADEFIRSAYRGGWCYLKPDFRNQWIDKEGQVFDVNSLYPSVMHSESGNYYPIGKPHFWTGDIPSEAKQPGRVFFVRVSVEFDLKPGHVPTVQIKNDLRYRPTEWLETSDILYHGKTHKYYYDMDGVLRKSRAVLTLSKPDLYLLLKHYNVRYIKYLGGCWFHGVKGLFDTYINHWMYIKETSKGAMRTLAKLMLNSLYGRFAMNKDSSYMIPSINDDGIIELMHVNEFEKPLVNIAVGAMITAYARYFTITAAQENYETFVYADTDSLHLIGKDAGKNLPVHETKMLHWKNEASFSRAKYIRQKTYCEFIRLENGRKVSPHWEIKCAGLPANCKRKFLATRPISAFDYGLSIFGKLRPVRVRGGLLLREDYFTMNEYKERYIAHILTQ